MRRLLFIIATCLLALIAMGQDPCSDEVIMNMKGNWTKRSSDVGTMADKNQFQVNARIDFISKLFQQAYPEAKGIQPGWYRVRGTDPTKNSGPISYSFSSLYFPWYCNQHAHKIMLASETGTWALVDINFVRLFLSDQYNLVGIKVGGYDVYKMPLKKGEWKGYPLYETPGWHGMGYSVVITHNGKLPWKTVSQEQYLQGVRERYDEQKNKSAEGYTVNEENIRKYMVDNQYSKYLKDVDKQKINADLQKRLDEIEKTKDASIARMNRGWDDKISAVDKYLNQARRDDLESPAIIDRNTELIFNSNFSTEAKGGTMLVTVDPSYFNMSLPRYVPQIMILNWRWEKNTPSLNFKKQIEENFPVEKLSAMLDK
jgi:hypothetical protein